MVLGQDWGTVKDFDTFKLKDAENLKNRTWSNMLELFRRAELDTRNCFFTNFFIGLRTGKSSVGRFPGASDIHYVKKCVTFFLNQVEIQKPRLILVLGAHIPKYLSTASSYLKEWQFFQNYKKLDKEGNAIIHCDDFNSIKHSCVLLSLVHPCYRQLNARHRNWEGLNGDAAELAMLRSAMASSGILSR